MFSFFKPLILQLLTITNLIVDKKAIKGFEIVLFKND